MAKTRARTGLWQSDKPFIPSSVQPGELGTGAPAWGAGRALPHGAPPTCAAPVGENRSRTCCSGLNCSNPQHLAANPARTVKWQFDAAISIDLQMAGSTIEALTEASNRKNPLCAPPRRMERMKPSSCPLLLSREQRAAPCCSSGRRARRGSRLQPRP